MNDTEKIKDWYLLWLQISLVFLAIAIVILWGVLA
jgi:hypothetical protein